MRTNDDCRKRAQTTMQYYSDCRKPGDNVYIYGNYREMINIYDFNWFHLIFDVVVDLLRKEGVQCEKVASSLCIHVKFT